MSNKKKLTNSCNRNTESPPNHMFNSFIRLTFAIVQLVVYSLTNPSSIQYINTSMPINLFSLPVVINLVLDDSATSGDNPVLNNYPLTRTDFNIILNITNKISVFVKDVDRTPIQLQPGQTFTINIVDYSTQTLLLTRLLTTVDPTQGLYSFVVTPTDTSTWQCGSPLSYTVTVNNPDGSQQVLWTDRNYSPVGFCQVSPGPIPSPPQPIVMNVSDFVITDGWATSPRVPGSIFPNGSMSFAFYATNYSGPIYIQGSLQAQPQDMYDWFQIDTLTVSPPTTGVVAATVTGNYTWLRVMIGVPEINYNQGLQLPVTTGVINQVIYKN